MQAFKVEERTFGTTGILKCKNLYSRPADNQRTLIDTFFIKLSNMFTCNIKGN